jgi:hypothetical protein
MIRRELCRVPSFLDNAKKYHDSKGLLRSCQFAMAKDASITYVTTDMQRFVKRNAHSMLRSTKFMCMAAFRRTPEAQEIDDFLTRYDMPSGSSSIRSMCDMTVYTVSSWLSYIK